MQWIALPVCWRCTPVNQWKKSAKNLKWIICRSKVQGFRTRGNVNQTTPSDQVHPCLSLWWRVLYVVDLNTGGYCWIRLSFISFPACSRNNTRRSSCQPDNTLRPSTPLPFSLMTGKKTPAKSILDGLPVVHLDEGGCCLLHLSFISSPDCWLITSCSRNMLCRQQLTTAILVLQVVHSTLASMWVELVAKLYLCYCPNLLRAAGSSILVWLEAIQSGN